VTSLRLGAGVLNDNRFCTSQQFSQVLFETSFRVPHLGGGSIVTPHTIPISSTDTVQNVVSVGRNRLFGVQGCPRKKTSTSESSIDSSCRVTKNLSRIYEDGSHLESVFFS